MICASTNYARDFNFVGYDEIDFNRKTDSLGIDEVKDIDSILSILGERIAYTGNIILGNSSFIDQSTTITECHYVLHSERVAFSKNVAYSTRGSYSENIFGCYAFGPSSFSIKSNEISESTRCFMTSKADFFRLFLFTRSFKLHGVYVFVQPKIKEVCNRKPFAFKR